MSCETMIIQRTSKLNQRAVWWQNISGNTNNMEQISAQRGPQLCCESGAANSVSSQWLNPSRYQINCSSWLVLLITSYRVAVQLLLSNGITYSVTGCTAVGTDCAENIIPLLFTGCGLVMADRRDSAILALSKYAHCLAGNNNIKKKCETELL
jgi:hypothetical protein